MLIVRFLSSKVSCQWLSEIHLWGPRWLPEEMDQWKSLWTCRARMFQKGNFLLFYRGKRITKEVYDQGLNVNCEAHCCNGNIPENFQWKSFARVQDGNNYMFINEKTLFNDAAEESSRLARFMNDDWKSPNAKTVQYWDSCFSSRRQFTGNFAMNHNGNLLAGISQVKFVALCQIFKGEEICNLQQL